MTHLKNDIQGLHNVFNIITGVAVRVKENELINSEYFLIH